MANSYRHAASQKRDRGNWSRMDDVFARESARRRPRHAGRLRAFHAAKADRLPVKPLPAEVREGEWHAAPYSPWYSEHRERGRHKVAHMTRRRARLGSPKTTGRHPYVEAIYAAALD